MSDLAEFDREAEAAARRAARAERHAEQTRATLGTGEWVRREDLRCEHCSYHLPVERASMRGQLVRRHALLLEPTVRAPEPSRPWRTVRCQKCKRTTVYETRLRR